jgi:Homeodomain-like domain
MRPEEVPMRPPSVFVRPLAPAEGQRLKRLSRQAKHASTRQRAAILLASATEMSAREIAEMWMTDESHVRKVIHDFNEHGFASLRPRFSCHWTPAIRRWAEHSNVELVPTPTYASYLNRIESHFGPIGEFVVKNADYLDWDSFGLAMANHISYRNDPDRRRQRLEQVERRLRLAA